MTTDDAVRLTGISKYFGDTVANEGVDLSVASGSIHALLGENGAGKTTLMNVLYGRFQPDEGEIYVDGQRRRFDSPRDALEAGIGMVHQHYMLVETMTVAENIFLGEEPKGGPGGLVDTEAERARVRELSEEYGFDLDPDALVRDVGIGVQQRVEILKTLSRGAEIIILDEPTAVLTPQEVDELLEILRALRDEGRTILFITHKLPEVLEIADRVTVLRDGRNAGTVSPAETTKAELAEMMVGREVLLDVDAPATAPGEPVLTVRELTVTDGENVDAVRDVDFQVREGEIFGVAGVDGNGQAELVEAIAGLRPVDAGDIALAGRDLTGTSRRERIDAGMSYVPEDRQTRGLVMDLDLSYNGVLGSQHSPTFSSGARLLWDRVRDHVEQLIETYDVRPGEPSESARSLSGGNAQKFIVGREFERDPSLLLASHPTRGVDVGSIEFIRDRLLEVRAEGAAVVLVSSKLDEVMQLSDRMAVMYDGSFIDVVDPDEYTEDEIGLLMAGERLPDRPTPQRPEEGV